MLASAAAPPCAHWASGAARALRCVPASGPRGNPEAGTVGPLLRDGEREAVAQAPEAELGFARSQLALRQAPADVGDPPLLPGRVPCPAPQSRLSVWPLHSLSLRHC